MLVEGDGSKRQSFKAGDTVLEQGRLAKGMYVLMSGELEVLYEGVKVAEITEKGAFVGEIASIQGGRRTATVKAKTDADMLYIENATRYFEENPASALSIAKSLAARIPEMDKKVAEFEKFVEKWVQAFDDVIAMDDIRKIKQELVDLHEYFVSQLRGG